MKRIICDPEILGGKPIIEGTRLSVEHVLGLLSNGMTPAHVCESYPELIEEDVLGVFKYATRSLKNDVVIDVSKAARAS